MYGRIHPRVALVLNELGNAELMEGRLDDAAADYKQVVEIYTSVFGVEHQETTVALANLATVYLKEKQYARATPPS